MSDVERALSEITNIRSQLAAGTVFRGFGPVIFAVSGVMALVAGGVQTIWPAVGGADQTNYVLCWIAVAVLVSGLIGFGMITRSKRLHGNMAQSMITTTIEQFLPVGAGGAAISAVLLKYSPDTLWTLPGLWQVLVAIGIFASLRTLPRAMSLAGGWYFISGITVLVIASVDQQLTPWMMAIPFSIGQFLIATVLWLAGGGDNAQEN